MAKKEKPIFTQIYPPYVSILESKKIKLNGETVVIKKRVNGLTEKPPLYLWNLTKSCYVSSLKETGKENLFTFDIRKDGSLILYNLIFLDGKIEVKEVA